MNIIYIKRKIDRILAGSILKLSKRQRFVISTFFLTISLITTQLLQSNKIFLAIGFLALLTAIFTIWCLWEEITGVEYFTLLIPTVLYTVAVGLFYYLLPHRWITRLPIAFLYTVGIYALLLTQNIYNVAAIRTIALLRAARAVNLLFSLITFFLLLNTLFSFHLSSIINFFIVLGISYLMFLTSFWGEKLTPDIEKNILIISQSLALLIAEIALVLSFWPLKVTFEALYLSTICYTFLGIGQHKIKEMPFKKVIWEYIILNILSLIMLIKTANWKI